MSKAEQLTIPPPPRLGVVLRTAVSDLYYHGVRLIVVNVVWGLGLLFTLIVLLRSPLGLMPAVAMIPLTAGLMGMATRVVRDRTIVLSDAWDGFRGGFWALFVIGVAQIGVGIVAVIDVLAAIQIGGFFGVLLIVVAVDTVLALWLLAVSTWPILLDPRRSADPIRARLRLGALLLVAHPIRIGGLAIGIGLLLAVSTILTAAIVTVSGAFAFLVAAHWVLPAADRLEGRATLEVEAEESVTPL